MATPAINPQPAPAPQGDGAGAPQSSPAAGALKLLAGMTRIAQAVAQSYPAASAEMEEINRQTQQAMQKIMGAQPGQQTQAPPV